MDHDLTSDGEKIIENDTTAYNIALELNSNLSDNTRHLQEWFDRLPKKVMEQINSKELMIHILFVGNTSYLEPEEQRQIEEKVFHYERMIHLIIGDVNGYHNAIIVKSSKYLKASDQQLITLSLVPRSVDELE